MIRALKAELLKLTTVRSTYILLFFTLALGFFISFYGNGMKLGTSELTNPGMLALHVPMIISVLSILIAFLGILSVTHEYRYNTIMYSLTAAKSRSHVFWAKWVVISVVATILSVAVAFLAIPFVQLGVAASGHELIRQSFPVWDVLWRVAFMGWAASMFGLLLAFIIRNQVGTFAAFFVIPTVEPILGLILGDNRIYLPFTALNAILFRTDEGASYGKAALIVLAYVVAGSIAAWYLFKRRDAN